MVLKKWGRATEGDIIRQVMANLNLEELRFAEGVQRRKWKRVYVIPLTLSAGKELNYQYKDGWKCPGSGREECEQLIQWGALIWGLEQAL